MAEVYDAARPSYPEEIFDDLARLAKLTKEDSIVEIGSGTGQASRSLCVRCGKLICLELGKEMAALATKNLSSFENVSIFNTTFEDWDGEESSTDLIFAASSWHWLDPTEGYTRAAYLLKHGGHLAILANHHVYPEGYDPLFDRVQELYVKHGVSAGNWIPKRPDTVKDLKTEIEGSGHFCDTTVSHYLWYKDYSPVQYTNLLGTYSDHLAMSIPVREALLRDIEDLIIATPNATIRKHNLSILHVSELSS